MCVAEDQTNNSSSAGANCIVHHTGLLCQSCALGSAYAGCFCEPCAPRSSWAELSAGKRGVAATGAGLAALLATTLFMWMPLLPRSVRVVAAAATARRSQAFSNASRRAFLPTSFNNAQRVSVEFLRSIANRGSRESTRGSRDGSRQHAAPPDVSASSEAEALLIGLGRAADRTQVATTAQRLLDATQGAVTSTESLRKGTGRRSVVEDGDEARPCIPPPTQEPEAAVPVAERSELLMAALALAGVPRALRCSWHADSQRLPRARRRSLHCSLHLGPRACL